MAGRPAIEHGRLRAAIELALGEADAGQRQRPPMPFPPELKPFLRVARVPANALGRLRRAIEADDEFRRRVAAVADARRVDPIGIEWLRCEAGWEARISSLASELDEEAASRQEDTALRRAERRREAAEGSAAKSRVEVGELRARVDDLARRVDQERTARAALDDEARRLREQVAESRRAERHANDRSEAAQARQRVAEAERDAVRAEAAAAADQRDVLLAARAGDAGVSVAAAQVTELRALAESARRVADRLAGLVDVGPQLRQPVALPGGVARDSARAAEHLLRVPGALIVVDGYNVSKLAWPDVALDEQRQRELDVVDDVARRYGAEVTVVFDGAEVVGAHARRRRLARVVYSPAGVTADDVITETVTATPPARPVVVVTNDRAVQRSVAAVGANVVSSDAFLAVARR